MSANDETPAAAQKSNLPMLLDPGTKGGALFLSLVLFIIPIIVYEICTVGFGLDGIDTGKWIGVGFTFFTTILWVGTYIFRVATKDMTYVSRKNRLQKVLNRSLKLERNIKESYKVHFVGRVDFCYVGLSLYRRI